VAKNRIAAEGEDGHNHGNTGLAKGLHGAFLPHASCPKIFFALQKHTICTIFFEKG
jgi:hypothetical protein